MDRVEFIKKMRNAIQNKELESVKKLLEEDEDKLNLVLPTGGWMNVAITYHSWEVMEYLLEKEIDKEILLPSNKGTALSTGAVYGNPKLIEFLIQSGYRLICDCDNSNPIFSALTSNKIENFQFLLELEKKEMTEEQYLQLCEMIVTEAKKTSNKKILEIMNVQVVEDKSIHMLNIDKALVKEMLKESIKKFMNDVIEAYDQEVVYITSIEIDAKDYKCYCYVNTKENLNSKVAKNKGKNKWYYYFCENEWDIIENAAEYFDKFTKYMYKECTYTYDMYELYEVVAEAVAESRREEKCMNNIIWVINAYNYCSQEEMIMLFTKMNKEEDCKDYIENLNAFF